MMTYTDDARIASSNVYTSSWLSSMGNNWQEMSGRKLGTPVNPRHTRATLQNEKLITQAKGDSGQHVTLSPRLSSITLWWLLYLREWYMVNE